MGPGLLFANKKRQIEADIEFFISHVLFDIRFYATSSIGLDTSLFSCFLYPVLCVT